MPRYFFNIENASIDEDHDGTELPGPAVARAQAVMFAGDYLRNDPGLVWGGHRLCVEVRDEAGRALLRAVITAADPGA